MTDRYIIHDHRCKGAMEPPQALVMPYRDSDSVATDRLCWGARAGEHTERL